MVGKVRRAGGNPAATMALLRRWHVYLSVLVAPSLILFAVTGALQNFRIPDRPDAPVLIQKLARVHKDDVFAVKPPRPPRPERASPDRAGKAERAGPTTPAIKPKKASELTKWVFTILSVIIAVTTAIGLWMALAYGRERRVMWLLAAAGVLAPVLALAI